MEELELIDYKKMSLGDRHVFRTPLFIDHIKQFSTLLDVCEQAHQDEHIILEVLCHGGDIDVVKAVCNALLTTKAVVYTVNKSVAASGGSALLMCGDSITFEPWSYAMIHTASYGKGVNITPEHTEYAKHSDQDIRSFYESIYADFVTEEELSDILKGTPLYITAEESEPRLNRMMEARESFSKDIQKSVELPNRESLMKMNRKDIINTVLGEEYE